MSNPRFGFQNVLHDFRNCVATLDDDDDQPYYNAYDWRPGTFWSPAVTKTLLTNGDLLLWAGGAAAAPDNWVLSGAGGTIARDSTNFAPKMGPYGAAITRVGTNVQITQTITSNEYRRLKVYCGVWAKATVAGTTRIRLDDSAGNITSSAGHTGGGGWEWLSVTGLVTSAATNVQMMLQVITTNTTSYFSGAVMVVDTLLSESPPPFDVSMYCFPANGQLLQNWYFNDFSSGVAAAPDGWTVTGTGAVPYRTMANTPKVGWNAAGLTRVGNDCYYSRNVGAADLADILGKRVSGGCWVRATVASRAYFVIAILRRDSATYETFSSGAHTGGSAYEWLEYENVFVPVDAVAVGVRLAVANGDTSVEFSGAYLTQAATAVQTPHAQDVDYFAMHSHNCYSGNWTVILEGSSDNFATDTDVFTVSPTTDLSFWRDKNGAAASSFAGWRVRFAAGDGAQRLQVGVMSFGEYLEFPWTIDGPFENLSRSYKSELVENRESAPLGRSIPTETKSYTMTFTLFDRSTVIADVINRLWAHAGGTQGLPFFFQWNDSGFSTETDFLWLGPEDRLAIPVISGNRVRSFSFDVFGSLA